MLLEVGRIVGIAVRLVKEKICHIAKETKPASRATPWIERPARFVRV